MRIMSKQLRYVVILFSLLASFTLYADEASTRVNPAIELALNQHIEGLLNQAIEKNRWQASSPAIAITLPQGSFRLAACKAPVEITRRDNRLYPAGRLRFTLQCNDTNGWSINAKAMVDVVVPMVYVNRTLAKDTLISREDISTKQTHLASVNRDFVAHPETVIGQRALRQVRNGQRLSPERISQPYLINRGDTLIIEAVGDNFSTSMQGTALDNGYLDQQIRVRNNSSGKTIRAVVMDSGKVHTLF